MRCVARVTCLVGINKRKDGIPIWKQQGHDVPVVD